MSKYMKSLLLTQKVIGKIKTPCEKGNKQDLK